MSNFEKTVRCPFNNCYKCCIDTQMLLTEDDVNRIVARGYKKDDFCFSSKESENFKQLKNVNNSCFFLVKGRCSIYDFRPIGCRTYPLVFNLTDSDVLIDDECREPVWFANQTYQQDQIQTVKNLAKTLLDEKTASLKKINI